jgi:protein associated with RNAse G/E
MDHYSLNVFQRNDWFNSMLNFDREGNLLLIYCNVTMPYSFDSGSLTWVDLDLDVVMAPESPASLVDADEFEAHSGEYGYPEHVVERSRATAAMLLDRAGSGGFPFRVDDLDATLAGLGVSRNGSDV